MLIKRFLIVLALTVGIWLLMIFALEYEYPKFDLSAFGYDPDMPTNQKVNDNLKPFYTKIPYSIFGSYRNFEPSGISRIKNTNYFIVINDKNEEHPLSVYQLTSKEAFKKISKFEFKNKDDEIDVSKLEAITGSKKKPGTFYVITSFDRNEPGYRKLIRFKLDKTNKLIEFKELSLYDPAKAVSTKLKKEWSKVEALALSSEEEYLFIGVRAIGKDDKNPIYKVIILRYDLNVLEKEPGILVNVDLQNILQRQEGISSLEFSHELNAFLLLTSLEDETNPVPKAQVGGHLWQIPEDLSKLNSLNRWRTFRRFDFEHKPEGVEMISANEAIVVFDDDKDRKSTTDIERKFKLAPNEAVYSIINLLNH